MAKELPREPFYHDRAVFYTYRIGFDGELNKKVPETMLTFQFYSFLNKVVEKEGTKKILTIEENKTSKEIEIIKLVLAMVEKYMILYGRNKILKFSFPFVHVVSRNSNYKEDAVFGGIVVERADDIVFAIKLFQKLFAKMSFSAIKVCEDRTILALDVGNDFKEAVASLMSRKFYKEAVKESSLFKEQGPIIEEECFNLIAEERFNQALNELWENNKGVIPKRKIFGDMVEATINGRILPLMSLRDRKLDQEETKDFLSWIGEVGISIS